MERAREKMTGLIEKPAIFAKNPENSLKIFKILGLKPRIGTASKFWISRAKNGVH